MTVLVLSYKYTEMVVKRKKERESQRSSEGQMHGWFSTVRLNPQYIDDHRETETDPEMIKRFMQDGDLKTKLFLKMKWAL